MRRTPDIQLVSVISRCLIVLALATAMLPVRSLFAEESIHHVVKSDETLSEIARQHGTDVETLLRLNALEDPNLIWRGLSLHLPDNGTSGGSVRQDGSRASADAPLNSEATGSVQMEEKPGIAPTIPTPPPMRTAYPPSTSPITHVVQQGEHLGILADRYNTTATAIARENDLPNASVIVPGQQLTIPQVRGEASITAERQRAGTAADPSPRSQSNVSEMESAESFHVHKEFPTQTEKWIDVDLSEQRVVAYEGKVAIKAFTVSTGLPGTPTVTGEFNIWAKTPIQDMSGGSRASGNHYYLEDVQWVQYFYEEYAFHGTYWHNSFGQPMSRGCVNMTNEDAKWLFDWASPSHEKSGWLFSSAERPGTLVIVHE